MEKINQHFKDIHGKTPRVGDFIIDEDKKIGKVLSFFKTDFKHVTNGYRMVVDFRSNTVEFNPVSKFEIIENPSKQLLENFSKGGILQKLNQKISFKELFTR